MEKIRIRDKHPGSATLPNGEGFFKEKEEEKLYNYNTFRQNGTYIWKLRSKA